MTVATAARPWPRKPRLPVHLGIYKLRRGPCGALKTPVGPGSDGYTTPPSMWDYHTVLHHLHYHHVLCTPVFAHVVVFLVYLFYFFIHTGEQKLKQVMENQTLIVERLDRLYSLYYPLTYIPPPPVLYEDQQYPLTCMYPTTSTSSIPVPLELTSCCTTASHLISPEEVLRKYSKVR